MYAFTGGVLLEKGPVSTYRDRLIQAFAGEYDIRSDRLWNCLRIKPRCVDFHDVAKLSIPGEVLFYLERSGETYRTTFAAICSYVNQLEPWELIDAYIFDGSYRWLICITHEDLLCLLVRKADPASSP